MASLAVGADGSFYGSPTAGGFYGYGTLFKMSPNGASTFLTSLGIINGSNPNTLTQGLDGNLIDWTMLGPAAEISPGLFEFTDLDAPGHLTRFYRLRSP